MTTQTRICAGCGEFFPAERSTTICRLCAFGPLASLVAALHADVDATALVVACNDCRAVGRVACPVCLYELGYSVGAFGTESIPIEEPIV